MADASKPEPSKQPVSKAQAAKPEQDQLEALKQRTLLEQTIEMALRLSPADQEKLGQALLTRTKRQAFDRLLSEVQTAKKGVQNVRPQGKKSQ